MNISKMTKEEIIKAIEENNEEVIEQIYSLIRKFLHQKRIYNEDNLQDCALRVVSKLHTFDDSKALFSTWVYKVCNSIIMMNYRKENAKKRKAQKFLLSLDSEYEDIDGKGILFSETLGSNYEDTERKKLIKEIYDNCISDLLKSWLDGYTQEELAKKYGVTQTQIHRRLKKEIKEIKETLEL